MTKTLWQRFGCIANDQGKGYKNEINKNVFIICIFIFLASNIFSQREDILEQMRKVTHNLIVNFPDETLSQDAILNGILKRTSKRNVLATYEVVDSAIATVWLSWLYRSTTYKYKYGFDSNVNMSSYYFEEWNGTNWVILDRHTYTYDSNGNMNSDSRSKWDGANWVNCELYTYTYDSNGNMVLWLLEKRDGTNWVNYKRYTYTYDGNKIVSLQEDWDGTNWRNDERYTYTYDSSGNRTLKLHEDWDGTNWVTRNYACERSTYTYDSNGNITLLLNENWDGTNWEYGNGSLSFTDTFGNNYSFYGEEIKIFYKTIIEVNENEFGIPDFSLSLNYPNPFNPSATISYSLPQSGFVQLKIYDMLGQEVATLVNEIQQTGIHKVEFNANGLTSGVYFYKLQSGSFMDTKKLILLR